MKIHPYLTVIQGQKQDQGRRISPRENASTHQTDTNPATRTDFRDIVEIVSLENRRSVSEDPPLDLGAAEAILEKAKDALGQMSGRDLGRLHRLEGLVHIYPG